MSSTQSLIEQLGLKKACLACHVEKAHRKDKLHGFSCYHCGTSYNDITGQPDPNKTKKLIYLEYQEKGITLSDKDVDLIHSFCTTTTKISFGGALNIMLQETVANRKRRGLS